MRRPKYLGRKRKRYLAAHVKRLWQNALADRLRIIERTKVHEKVLREYLWKLEEKQIF